MTDQPTPAQALRDAMVKRDAIIDEMADLIDTAAIDLEDHYEDDTVRRVFNPDDVRRVDDDFRRTLGFVRARRFATMLVDRIIIDGTILIDYQEPADD